MAESLPEDGGERTITAAGVYSVLDLIGRVKELTETLVDTLVGAGEEDHADAVLHLAHIQTVMLGPIEADLGQLLPLISPDSGKPVSLVEQAAPTPEAAMSDSFPFAANATV